MRIKGYQSKKRGWNIDVDLKGIKHTDIMMFTQHLAVALKSDFTLLDAIEMLQEQSTGKMMKVLDNILQIVRAGRPLHSALEQYPKYFSPIYVNMVKTGEMAGTLADNLNNLAEQLKKAHEMRQKVKSALMYPMLVLIAVTGLGLSISIFVLPKILPLFKSLNTELPMTTKGLLFVADVFSKYGVSILIGVVFSIIAFSWLIRREFIKPIWHKTFFKMPVVSKIMIYINLQRFTLMFGTMLESGIPLVETLRISADATENRVYRKAILSFIPAVQKGNSIAEAMGEHVALFPKFTGSMVGMGEKTGNLESNLKYLSNFYEGEVDSRLKNLSTIIEPFLLIIIGGLVALVAMAILGPIYKISGSLRN